MSPTIQGLPNSSWGRRLWEWPKRLLETPWHAPNYFHSAEISNTQCHSNSLNMVSTKEMALQNNEQAKPLTQKGTKETHFLESLKNIKLWNFQSDESKAQLIADWLIWHIFHTNQAKELSLKSQRIKMNKVKYYHRGSHATKKCKYSVITRLKATRWLVSPRHMSLEKGEKARHWEKLLS